MLGHDHMSYSEAIFLSTLEQIKYIYIVIMDNEGHTKIVNFMTAGAAGLARAWPSTSYSENALSVALPIKNVLVSSLRVIYNCILSIAGSLCTRSETRKTSLTHNFIYRSTHRT